MSNFGSSIFLESFYFPHLGSDFLGKHATKMHNSTTMCAIYLHTTCKCTSSLHARCIYVLIRPIHFVRLHVCINTILEFQVFFLNPRNYKIDFLNSHIHRTVEVGWGPHQSMGTNVPMVSDSEKENGLTFKRPVKRRIFVTPQNSSKSPCTEGCYPCYHVFLLLYQQGSNHTNPENIVRIYTSLKLSTSLGDRLHRQNATPPMCS